MMWNIVWASALGFLVAVTALTLFCAGMVALSGVIKRWRLKRAVSNMFDK